MILNFGPCEVYYEGVSLDKKTAGGITLNLATQSLNPVQDDYDIEELIVGGTGMISFYSWHTSITLETSNLLLDYGEVVLLGENATIILYKCKMLLDGSMETGALKQKPIKVKLIFTANDAGKVFKLQ